MKRFNIFVLFFMFFTFFGCSTNFSDRFIMCNGFKVVENDKEEFITESIIIKHKQNEIDIDFYDLNEGINVKRDYIINWYSDILLKKKLYFKGFN